MDDFITGLAGLILVITVLWAITSWDRRHRRRHALAPSRTVRTGLTLGPQAQKLATEGPDDDEADRVLVQFLHGLIGKKVRVSYVRGAHPTDNWSRPDRITPYTRTAEWVVETPKVIDPVESGHKRVTVGWSTPIEDVWIPSATYHRCVRDGNAIVFTYGYMENPNFNVGGLTYAEREDQVIEWSMLRFEPL